MRLTLDADNCGRSRIDSECGEKDDVMSASAKTASKKVGSINAHYISFLILPTNDLIILLQDRSSISKKHFVINLQAERHFGVYLNIRSLKLVEFQLNLVAADARKKSPRLLERIKKKL